jgi:hypothetical protein
LAVSHLITGLQAVRRPLLRRLSAFTRATSSRIAKGSIA